MKHVMTAVAAALAVGCVPAIAADIPARAPVYKAPPAPYVQSWTGCYLGANVGGGWSNIDAFNLAGVAVGSKTTSGVAGGGQVGCDYQFAGNWVLGIQGMFDGAGISSDDSLGVVHSSIPWFATVTGRLGYAIAPSLLIYGKGGVAFARDHLRIIATGANSNLDQTGWTAGGGAEWMFAPNWSVFVEYNYMDFGSNGTTFSDGTIGNFNQNVQTVLGGVNFRF